MSGKCYKELFLLELDLAMTKKEVRNSGLNKIRLIFLSLLENPRGHNLGLSSVCCSTTHGHHS